ncbi:hypothetical protein IJ596_05685 [bacterium]|nr:hypothetical protein [bacterium]
MAGNIRRQSYLMPIPENYTSLSAENLEDKQALGVICQIILVNQNKDKIAKMK